MEVEEDLHISWIIDELEFELEHFVRVATDDSWFPEYVLELVSNIKNFQLAAASWSTFPRLGREVEKVRLTTDRLIGQIENSGSEPADQLLDIDKCLERIFELVQIIIGSEPSEIDQELQRSYGMVRVLESVNNLFDLIANSKGDGLPVATVKTDTPSPNDAPTTSLHPAVISAAAPYISARLYRNALEETARALFNATIKKANRPDMKGGGTNELLKIFSKKDPNLRVSEDDDVQAAAMWLFAGMMMGIRNVRAHHDGDEMDSDPAEVAEWLGFLSALFRMLDRAVLVEKDKVPS